MIINKNNVMDKFIKIFLWTILSVVFASCSSMQKVAVRGTPDTEIYDFAYTYLGTVGPNGIANIRLSKKKYDAFLYYRPYGSNVYIPFAVDYRYKNYVSIAYWAMLPPYIPQMIAALSAPKIRSNYNFKYQFMQNTNQDLTFANYVNSGPVREVAGNKKVVLSDEVNTSANNSNITVSSKARSRTSKSNKTLKDFGTLLKGTYIGIGKLLFNDEVIERYNNMKVVISRIDNNNVMVEVIESNGEKFFISDNKYNVRKKDAGFSLSLQGVSSAVITINGEGNLVYRHPKVNIDGDIYTLEISASRK